MGPRSERNIAQFEFEQRIEADNGVLRPVPMKADNTVVPLDDLWASSFFQGKNWREGAPDGLERFTISLPVTDLGQEDEKGHIANAKLAMYFYMRRCKSKSKTHTVPNWRVETGVLHTLR